MDRNHTQNISWLVEQNNLGHEPLETPLMMLAKAAPCMPSGAGRRLGLNQVHELPPLTTCSHREEDELCALCESRGKGVSREINSVTGNILGVFGKIWIFDSTFSIGL